MASHNHLDVVNRVAVVRDYAALWQQFFTFFSDENLEERVFTEQEEEEFAGIVSVLALNHFKFQELSRDYFKDPEGVLKVLGEAVSLAHIRELPGSTLGKVQVEWHTLFIAMNKALGRLISEIPQKRLAEMQASEQAPSGGSAA